MFSMHIHKAIGERRIADQSFPVTGGAFFSMLANALAIHRAVLTLCEGGWAAPASSLLRTLADYLINCGVIGSNRSHAEYMAFKYLHAHLAEDSSSNDELRAHNEQQLTLGLSRLSPEDRTRAESFISARKFGPYWYSPEYKSPNDVLKKLARPDAGQLYRLYSRAAHGGFIGGSLHKYKSDDIHPNPRADRHSQNMALFASSRFIVEMSGVRADLELGQIPDGFFELLAELGRFGGSGELSSEPS